MIVMFDMKNVADTKKKYMVQKLGLSLVMRCNLYQTADKYKKMLNNYFKPCNLLSIIHSMKLCTFEKFLQPNRNQR